MPEPLYLVHPKLPPKPTRERRPARKLRTYTRRRRLTPEVIAQMVADYDAGVSTPELVKRYNLGKETVLKLLRDHGAKLRRQGLSESEQAEAVELYESGLSLAVVGARLGYHPSSIRSALRHAGIQLRSGRRGRR